MVDHYMEYSLISTLLEEVCKEIQLHPQISQLILGFVRYLKEPRYQLPLNIDELSRIFSQFYRDLNCLIVNFYTNSNNIKKLLIKNSSFLNEHDNFFDYLLAIANNGNTQGNGKLVKRLDPDALHQLRVFNYYKFIVIFQSIELAQKVLFESLLDDLTLYDKVFKFEQKDLIHEEFLYEKIEQLKLEKLPFSKFGNDKFSEFIDNIKQEDLQEIEQAFISLDSTHTPYAKLSFIVKIHKLLIQVFISSGYKNHDINNDILLPTLIYLIIYKINTVNIYSNFLFIKHFLNMLDPYHIELYLLNVSNTYEPVEKLNKIGNKYKQANLFDLLLIDNTENETLELGDQFQFFNNDKDLITYLSNNYLNNGELNYYLTNFEAVIMFLSNITMEELTQESSSSELLNSTVFELVEQDLQNHFKFPEPKIDEEKIDKSDNKSVRSRSSSILNSLTNKFHENRTRSNSSVVNSLRSSSKESFPTVATTINDIDSMTSPDDNLSVSLMKNILGRFNSISVSQFNLDERHENEVHDLASGMHSISSGDSANSGESHHTNNSHGNDAHNTNGDSSNHTADSNSIYSRNNSLSSHTNSIHLTPKVISTNNRNVSFINRISPSHTRTRSSSLDQGKRNTITNKLTNGVNEFMTKLNSSALNPPSALINKINTSNSSINSIEEGGNSTATLKQDYTRSRNSSLQVMDKWFNNISANLYHSTTTKNKDLLELTKFKDVEFDSLTIKDMKALKQYYDILCQQSLHNEKDHDDVEDTIINETSIHTNGNLPQE